MKKLVMNLLLVLFVVALGVVACSDVADQSPLMEPVQEVNLDNVAFETDQTPPDTGAVIR